MLLFLVASNVILSLLCWDDELLVVALGPNSIETFWLEFGLKNHLSFGLRFPYTKKLFKNG